MCTITYLPTGKDSFILTSNRDESKIRPTYPPAIEIKENVKLLFPKDALAGGTWICVSDKNRIACIMNGAFEKHEWKPPYRKSRGLVVLDLFGYKTTNEFFQEYDFEGIEPFTMIIYDNLKITEFRWDGKHKQDKTVDASLPHIWSSASLYPKPVRDKRKGWFQDWLKGRGDFRQEDILKFHRFGGEGDRQNDFVMNRYDMVQTVSITSIVKTSVSASMRYHDLVTDAISETTLQFSGRQILESR